jgi:hypothetical protein
VDWTDLVEDRNKWLGVVNTVNEPSGSIKCGEFPEGLRKYQLLKKDYAAWSYFLIPQTCGHIQGPAMNIITIGEANSHHSRPTNKAQCN